MCEGQFAMGSRSVIEPSFVGLEAMEPRMLLSYAAAPLAQGAFDPSPLEQEMLEWVNHMRMDPAGHLQRLVTSISPLKSPDSLVQFALDYYKVSGTALQNEWQTLAPAPPVGWHEALWRAGHEHNLEMIARDSQQHQFPGQLSPAGRAQAHGYGSSFVGENIYAYAESVFHGHSGFAIDWGDFANDVEIDGMQDPPGHRINIMRPEWREVGIAITPESNQSTFVGPLVVTQDFGRRTGADPYLLGVVYHDKDSDGYYDAGEGVGGTTVTVIGADGTLTTQSMSAGGFQIALTPGTYTVVFDRGAGLAPIVRTAVIGGENVKIDAVVNHPVPTSPEIVVTFDGINIADGDTTPSTRDGTDFGGVTEGATPTTRTFTVHNFGGAALTTAGLSVPEGFAVIEPLASSIAPGGSDTFTVRLNAQAVGIKSGTLSFTHNDTNESPYNFTIRGQVNAAPAPPDKPNPPDDPQPPGNSSLTLPAVMRMVLKRHQRRTASTFVIGNATASMLTFTLGSPGRFFKLAPLPPLSQVQLDAGDDMSMKLIFKGRRAPRRTVGQLTFTTDAGTQTIKLVGINRQAASQRHAR